MSKPLDLDATLAGWNGHPARTDQDWDEAADRIVAAATARPAPAGDAPTTDALFSMPTLAPEPGEPVTAGVVTMSESDDDKPRPSLRRPSLKELAERVSKAPPPASSPPSSLSAVAQPPPSSPPSSLGGMGPTSAAPASLAALARASQPVIAERGSQPPASASQPPTSGSQPPMPASQPPASAAPPSVAAPVAAANVVPIQQAKKSSGGSNYLTVGMLVVGLAAAAAGGFIYLRADKSGVVSGKSPTAADAPAEAKPAATAEAKAKTGEDGAKAEGGPAGDGAIDIAALGDATAEPASTDGTAPVAPLGSGALALGGAKPDAPVKIEPTGDLETAMKDAVGADDQKKTEAEPAAADTKPGGALPDRPPQGSVTSAVSGSMGAAKGCVAGADDVSRATITFGSSGAVQSVSVSGWAAGKPAAGCIKSAFQGANVGPFSRPTFTFGVTIRP